MEYHPYTEIWPLLEGADLDKLKADITTNGLRVELVTYQGKLLDGRNRERACEAAGVSPRYVEAGVKSDQEALDLVVSLNEHRRHLTLAQRAFAASKLANILHGGYGGRIKLSDESLNSNTPAVPLQEAAKRVGSTWGSAARARTIHLNGTPQDEADVVSGKTSLTAKAAALTGRKAWAPPSRKPQAVVLPYVPAKPSKFLSPQEVDPEFTGSPMEFTELYGHNPIMTAEQYATTRFSNWVSYARALVKTPLDPVQERPVDHNWLRSPKPSDVGKLEEALDFLRLRINELEALLATATSALEKLNQP